MVLFNAFPEKKAGEKFGNHQMEKGEGQMTGDRSARF